MALQLTQLPSARSLLPPLLTYRTFASWHGPCSSLSLSHSWRGTNLRQRRGGELSKGPVKGMGWDLSLNAVEQAGTIPIRAVEHHAMAMALDKSLVHLVLPACARMPCGYMPTSVSGSVLSGPDLCPVVSCAPHQRGSTYQLIRPLSAAVQVKQCVVCMGMREARQGQVGRFRVY